MNEKKVPRNWVITRRALLESGAGAAIVPSGVIQAATGEFIQCRTGGIR